MSVVYRTDELTNLGEGAEVELRGRIVFRDAPNSTDGWLLHDERGSARVLTNATLLLNSGCSATSAAD